MKRSCLIFVALFVFAFSSSWAQCPEDTNDHGECDTLHVEPWPDDILVQGDPPYFVRVPIYVTNDVPDPTSDSICGFTIPLCYYHTNTTTYCSLNSNYNNINLDPTDPNSIFRHLEISPGDTIFNWMASVGQWEVIVLKFDEQQAFEDSADWFLATVPFQAQQMGEGSRTLLATMTFKVGDTTTICIDSCFHAPSNHVYFGYGLTTGGRVAIPRPGTGTNSFEVCFSVVPGPPNDPPDSFSLLFPPNKAFTPRRVRFDWETATDPNPMDQVTYDLYVSTSYHHFLDSATVDSDLIASEHSKTLDLGVYYWRVKAKDNHGDTTWSNQIRYFMVTGIHHGDLTKDGSIDIGDVVFSINYLYRSGLAPDPLKVGDCNCDEVVDLGDVVFLINYLFRNGPLPTCP